MTYRDRERLLIGIMISFLLHFICFVILFYGKFLNFKMPPKYETVSITLAHGKNIVSEVKKEPIEEEHVKMAKEAEGKNRLNSIWGSRCSSLISPISKSGPVLNPMLRKMRSQNSLNCISTTSTPTHPRRISSMNCS